MAKIMLLEEQKQGLNRKKAQIEADIRAGEQDIINNLPPHGDIAQKLV